MTTDAAKITVYPPGPIAPNSPIQSVVIEPGDEVEWVYMSVACDTVFMNYIYGYRVIKPVNLYQAGKQIKKIVRS